MLDNEFERNLVRVDALEAVVRELINVLTPEQLAEFRKNTKQVWEMAEKSCLPELKGVITNTKKQAFKLSSLD